MFLFWHRKNSNKTFKLTCGPLWKKLLEYVPNFTHGSSPSGNSVRMEESCQAGTGRKLLFLRGAENLCSCWNWHKLMGLSPTESGPVKTGHPHSCFTWILILYFLNSHTLMSLQWSSSYRKIMQPEVLWHQYDRLVIIKKHIHVFLRQTGFSSHGHLAGGAKNQYK